MSDDYRAFLERKAPTIVATGIATESGDCNPALFDFQRECVAFCLTQGRSGLFLDTGLGKTLCELEFATKALPHTNRRALVLTPLAVARQIEREAHKFGYDARVIREQTDAADGINICNYDRLDRLDPDEFGVIVLDESSILKSYSSKTAAAIIKRFAAHRFKMAATATPAPNDHMELGQHSEFVGAMSTQEMLSRFFINDTSTASQEWRLKGHAEQAFWDWMASWCRMAQTPDDLGFDGSRFILPPLNVVKHRAIGSNVKPADGSLFAFEASATAVHDVKRQTTANRADKVAELVSDGSTWVIWCDTDYEADAINKRVADCVEVRGSHSVELKEERLAAFAGGEARVILSKPSICGYGVNWQHCSNMVFVGRSFSYENWYQAVRRCWRFGQTKPVNAHVIVAEGEDQIGRVIDRKSADHERMKRAMAEAMRRAMGRAALVKTPYNPTHNGRLPTWLSAA